MKPAGGPCAGSRNVFAATLTPSLWRHNPMFKIILENALGEETSVQMPVVPRSGECIKVTIDGQAVITRISNVMYEFKVDTAPLIRVFVKDR
jgi:hypothetical protein